MRGKLKIQIAIQGGGAKIVALMAVLEALEGMDDKFEVTRIVGTSAGAIAGVMFASDVGIANIIQEWKKGQLAELIDGFVIPRVWGLPPYLSIPLQLIKRKTVWDSAPIHRYLETVLRKHDEPVGDFNHLATRKGIKVTVMSTNLRNRLSVPSDMDEPVIPALLDSIGLPYLLRKWGDETSPVVVDGGIGDNLPATRLDMHREDETPVCISFRSVVGEKSNPVNFTQFSLALLDSAIEVSATQSAALVPHTLFINTTLTTFDFDKALAALHNGEFERIAAHARKWFDDLYDNIHTVAEEQRKTFALMNLHPWQSDNTVAQAVMAGVWRAVNGQFANHLLRYHLMEYRATLNCLQPVPGSDILTFSIEFEAGEEALYCYWLGVSNGVASQLTKEQTLTIVSVETGELVPYVRVPATGPEPDDQYARYEVIFFTPPLLAGKRYRLVQTETGINLLKDLAPKRKDDFGVNPTRALGKVGEVKLIIDIPDYIENYSIKVKPKLIYDSLEETYPEDMVKRTQVPHMLGYKTHMIAATGTTGIFALDITIGS